MNGDNKEHGNTLRPFVEMLQVGDPIGHRNLTLVPLSGEGHQRLSYVLAAEALPVGTLTVTETSESGSVPELLAVTQGERMVLLLDGEELVGAKQNRILNTTVLLPARAKTKIPVSCVEQGRWRHTSDSFAPGSYSPSRLRARKSRDVTQRLYQTGQAQSDQGAVWEEVSSQLSEVAASSPTMAMHDAVQQRRASLDSYTQALPYPQGARGVVVAIGGRFAAVDLFDQPETLQRVWPRLLTSYAMDALVNLNEKDPGSSDKPSNGQFAGKGASALLERLGQVECHACPTVGLGEDWRFEAQEILGQALVLQGNCIHMSAFPAARNDVRGHRDAGLPIRPPSHRRHRHSPENKDEEIVP